MNIKTIGERLKEERQRLGLSQEAFGLVGGVKKLAQISYEQGKTVPDAGYLSALANIGLDVLYVVVGRPSHLPLTTAEGELLAAFRSLDTRDKSHVFMLLNVMSAPDEEKKMPSTSIHIAGDVGQQFTGDVHGPITGPTMKKTIIKKK